MLRCTAGSFGGAAMTVKRFRLQADKCAALAKQTHDEESRARFLQLRQTYLHLAETEEQHERLAGSLIAVAAEKERKTIGSP
jgi:hypothetical protein